MLTGAGKSVLGCCLLLLLCVCECMRACVSVDVSQGKINRADSRMNKGLYSDLDPSTARRKIDGATRELALSTVGTKGIELASGAKTRISGMIGRKALSLYLSLSLFSLFFSVLLSTL